MADIGLKIQILRKSIGTFVSWLTGCEQLLSELPTELQNCQSSHLRELALKYKDLLLQMKERCSYMQEVNNLCKEIGDETSEVQSSPEGHNPELAELATEVRDLNTRFTTTLLQAKQHYTDLSETIAAEERADSRASAQGNPPSRAGNFPTHLPPRPDKTGSPKGKSPVNLRGKRFKKRKRSKSLHIPNDEDDGPTTPALLEIVELDSSPKLRRSKSWSVPTDLDDLMNQAAEKGTVVASDNGPGAQAREEDSRKIAAPTNGTKPLNIPKLSLDSSKPPFVRNHDLTPLGILRGSKRINQRPRSAVVVSEDGTQFVYLDGQTTPLSATGSTELVAKAMSNHISGQRSSAQSLGDVTGNEPRPLLAARRGSSNQNTSILSDSSSLGGSNLTVDGVCGRVESGARRSKSMDELAAVGSDEGDKEQNLSGRLKSLTHQLQEFVHSIAESRKCALQSLALELHLGEVKAMLTILEVHDTELTRLRATFSPLARKRLEDKKDTLKTVSTEHTYPKEQVADNREEILKLSERVALLKQHCEDAVEQTGEVLELVVQYEKQFKSLKDFLTDHASKVEVIKKKTDDHPDESWGELSVELTTVSEEKNQLKNIHELSVHLLYLEPIFDGTQVREDLKGLTEKFQQLTLQIFGLLEEQAKQRTEVLLLETSVMSSWITEASLSVQALAKKAKKHLTPKTKLAATKETLTQDLHKHQSTLDVISDKLHPLTAVLNPDETPNLDELVRQVENNRKNMKQIAINLSDINIHSSQDNLLNNPSDSGIPRSMTISEGIKMKTQNHGRSGSDIGVNEQIKQLQATGEITPVATNVKDDDSYAEIGSLRAEILNRKFSGDSGKGIPPRPLEGQRSLYERVDLPSPLVEFDHAPSRPLDNAIEMLPQSSSANSLPHTPTHTTSSHSTPSHHPNGRQVQYIEIDVSVGKNPTLQTDQSKSVSELDNMQDDPMYAEIDKKGKKIPAYAEINKFRKSGYADMRKVTSSPDLSSKGAPKYAEIDIAPALKVAAEGDNYAEIEARELPPEPPSEEKVKRKIGGRQRRRKRRLSLHEELLEFIGEEWADLSLKKTAHQAALDEAALDQSLGNIDNIELRNKCQRFVRGVREIEAGVQGVMEQISILKPPGSPDLERVHSAIDQCQKLLDRLNKLHPRLDSCNNESLNLIGSLGRSPTYARVSQLIEIRLFEVSTQWYSANLKASTHMRELRSQEGDINYLYRQLQQLSRVLKEASTLLGQKDTLTNVDDYLASCKLMSVKLSDLSDLCKQVSGDIKDTVSQCTQTSITRELVDQMKEVNSQWKSTTRQLQKMPKLEQLLIQLALANISSELVSMETTFSTLEVRALRVEEAATNCSNCKTQLERARLLNSSLASIKIKLTTQQPAGDQLDGPKQDDQSDEPKQDDQSESGEQTAKLFSQCEAQIQQVDRIMTRTENLSVQLQDESDLIVQFYSELNDLQLWMSDTVSMLQLSAAAVGPSVAQLRGKHQAIFQQIVTRQAKFASVQALAERLVAFPSNPAEKQLVENQLSDVCTLWDNLCKQIVPAGSLPQVMTPVGTTGRKLQFEPPADFEDIQQMVDWLSMIEFKLQPKPIVVGDVKQIRRCLQDLQMIASEVRSREGDYNRFVEGGQIPLSLRSDSISTDFDPELSSTVRSLLGVSTPEGVYQVPPKFVKFHDENTLERRQRRQEITDQHEPEDRNGDSGATQGEGDSSELDGSLTGYHSEGPETGQWNGVKSRSGMELRLDSMESRQPQRQLSDINPEEETSLTSLSSQLMTPMNDDVYQLFLLWKGVWASLGQQRKRFESTLEVWRNFEVVKEEVCNFLANAEDRVDSFFKSLSDCKDLTVVQTEIAAQQTLFKESGSFSQRLATLNQLSDDLITNRHSNDDTSDLKDMMADLNKRWKVVLESISQHQPTVVALATRWAEFYKEYQSFQLWIRNLDTDMSNLNPFVSDLASVKIQLDKMKEIQKDLRTREGGVEGVRLLAYKLLQGVGGCHVNSTAVHGRLDNLGRRVGHLETLAQERRTALEQALTEKQDFLSHLADTLAWLTQAEKHLISQKPLGTDYDTIHSQYQAHQTFWKEVLEQEPKIKSVIASGNRLANESHWTQGTGEDLRVQFGGVAPRWERVRCEAEEWGQLLGGVYPEMDVFQTLCSECGQKLSDSELVANRLEPVSRKLPILDKQLEALNIFEANLVTIGNQLEAIVLSQRKQVQLGVKVTSDLYQLVKRFHQRWNQLKQLVDERRVAIQRAQIQYDPANLSTTDLPIGWKRATTDNGTPYFINTTGGRTQWEHPDLSSLYSTLGSTHSLSSYPSPAYPVALKLRALQQKTHLALLRTKSCVNVYTTHMSDPAHKSSPSNHDLSFYDMTVLVIELFQTIEDEAERGEEPVARDDQFYINRAVEMTSCWLRDVYDVDHAGRVNCTALMIATVCLSKGKLEDKYKALFKVISGGSTSIDMDQVTKFLEDAMMLGQSVSEGQFCSLHAVDVCARECFRKYVGVGRLHLPQFISWLQSEPPPLSWLPILHRLGASEHAHHDVKCNVCKSQPITGFRYRCVQCTNFDMCQNCYWAGLTAKGHDRTKHFMEEYCLPKPAEESKDFLKTIRKSFRRSKKKGQTDLPLFKQDAAKVGGADHTHPGTPVERRWTTVGKGSPTTAKRHTAYVPISIGEYRRKSGGGIEGASMHPGRRFTVLEDSQSAWRMSNTAAAAERGKLRRASSPPPSGPGQIPGVWRQSKPPPLSKRSTDMEESLTKISQTSKSLSFRLRSLREKATSPGSPDCEETPDRDGARSPTPEEELRRRNAMLQGRVQLLQEHNLRLENCISQLKLIASLQQTTRHGSLRPLPAQPKPHPSPRPPPLPSRTPQSDIYNVPRDMYDLPPSDDAFYDQPPTAPADYEIPPSMRNGAELYSVPMATRRTSSPAELYSVPSGRKLSTQDVYSVPPLRGKTSTPEMYSVPQSRNTPELYSVPQSHGKTSSPDEMYDVPPPRPTSSPQELYDVPSKGPKVGESNHRSFQGGNETYDIPPPRILSAQPNPEIPPPRLPRRTNTAPSTGARKSSTSLL